jgi:hypothetical protein
MAGALNAAGVNAVFPTTQHRIEHMTGARGKVEGTGHPAEDGVVKGET